MDEITHEVRLESWKKICTECSSRPEGMTARQWLKENNVPEKQYYYWQRQIRHEAYGQMKQSLPVERKPAEVTFAEITPPAVIPSEPIPENRVPEAVIRIGCAEIEISSSTSDKLLSKLIKAVSHAC